MGKEIKNDMIIIKEDTNECHLHLYGHIGSGYHEKKEDDITQANILKALQDTKAKKLYVHINSPGGLVHESIGIANTLKSLDMEKMAVVEGICASGATLIASACDKAYIYASAQYMVHNAWMFASGNAQDFRDIAEELEQLSGQIRESYMTRFKGSEEELKELMAAEKILTAKQALEYGFVDDIIDKIENIKSEEEKATHGAITKPQHNLLTVFQLKR